MRKSIYCLVFACLLFTALLPAQDLAELEASFSKTSDPEQQLELLQKMATAAEQTDLEQSLDFIKQGVALAEKTGSKEQLPRFHEMEGRVYANTQRFDSATVFFDKALAGYVAVGDKKGEASAWLKKAYISRWSSDFDKALEYDFKALPLMEALGDDSGMARVYEYIAQDLGHQKKPGKAMEYIQKSIALAKKSGDNKQLMYSLGTAGTTSLLTEDFQKFYDYTDRAINLAQSENMPPSNIAPLYNDRGNALKFLGRYDEAIADYKRCLGISKKTGFKDGVAASTANIGDIYMRMGKYKEALPYKLKTIELQAAGKSIANLPENYMHTSTIYENMGDHKTALDYYKKFKTAQDSLVSVEKDATMSELLTKYETEKKEALISSQKEVIGQQKTIQWGVIGFAAILSFFMVLLYRNYKAKQKTNALLNTTNNQLEKKNAENELLLKEIHHRVKNNLETVSSLLALQSAHIQDPTVLDAMQESQNRVQSMGIIHQKLYQGKNLAAIEMKDYFINLSENILDSFGAENRINVECAMDALELDVDTAVPVGLIVNELLTNALKYAFPENIEGQIKISLKEIEKGKLELKIADNGVGKDILENKKSTGFGTQLVQLLTTQLGGKLEEINKGGTIISMQFKHSIAA